MQSKREREREREREVEREVERERGGTCKRRGPSQNFPVDVAAVAR